MNEGLHLGTNASYPFLTIREIIDKVAEQIGLIEPEFYAPQVDGWIRTENARRAEAYEAWRSEPVHVEGVPLVVGRFYDVTLKAETYGYTRKPRAWRVCRYKGRRRDRDNHSGKIYDYFEFGRWGAGKPDKWRHEKHDAMNVSNLLSVVPVTPDPEILKKLLEGTAGR